jgi:teichuronic acid biosynthesis glycosyltransferase TuaG
MNDSLISIIMPVYNGERYVSEAIESVLSQTYQNFELIIVNDGSTDNSKTAIDPYLKDPRIRYFEQNNAGVAAARNTAIKESQGEFIGFLDQDDIWHPTKLEIQINFLENHQDISLVYSDYIIYNEIERSNSSISDLDPIDFSQCDLISIFSQNRIGVLTVLLKKKCLIDSGLLDTQLKGTDDYELWLRLVLDYKYQYISQPLATYRWHGENASNNKLKMMEQEANAISSFLKKRPDAYKILGGIINNRLFGIYNEIGNLLIWKHKDNLKARQFYLLALKQKPFRIEIIRNFLITLVPISLSKFINWQLHKLNR